MVHEARLNRDSAGCVLLNPVLADLLTATRSAIPGMQRFVAHLTGEASARSGLSATN